MLKNVGVLRLGMMQRGETLANNIEAYMNDGMVVGTSLEGYQRSLRKVLSTAQDLEMRDAIWKIKSLSRVGST